jgi:hypothetical protein
MATFKVGEVYYDGCYVDEGGNCHHFIKRGWGAKNAALAILRIKNGGWLYKCKAVTAGGVHRRLAAWIMEGPRVADSPVHMMRKIQ